MRRHNANLEGIWQKAKKYVKNIVKDTETYTLWIEGIIPVSMGGGGVVLGVSNEFTADWIHVHFGEVISDALKDITGRALKIRYETGYLSPIAADPEKKRKICGEKEQPKKTKICSAPNCNPRFTFTNFVVGCENRFAYEAAMGMLSVSNISANPLFIYSGSGLGKTHLLQAVANEAKSLNHNTVVEYLRCEDFMNLFYDSLRNKSHYSFRDRFRKVDFLLIDDIQFLAGKSQLQEEFFNTFNKLYNEDRKILLTSDKSLSEINGLEQRLVSRFASGLTVEIEPFGVETRFAILRKKQEDNLIKFDDEVLWFVAENTPADVRKLEGALRRLLVYSSLKKLQVTLEMAHEVLKDYLAEMAVSKLSVDLIQKKVAEFFDLRVSDLTGSKRPANIAVPRMVAMFLCRKMTERSLPEIGEAFGRNHATVIHAVNKIEEECASNENMNRTIIQLRRKLQPI